MVFAKLFLKKKKKIIDQNYFYGVDD